MRQELHFTDNSVETQNEVLSALKAIAEDNSKRIDEKGNETIGFQRSFGYISFEGQWGLSRGDEDDVIALSEKFPTLTFTLIRDFQREVTTTIEDLAGRYSRLDIKDGSLVGVFQPSNITWVQV
jgi:hypothetical protein